MDVKGKKITVLGAARSGVAAAIMLAENGATVFVSDMATEDKIYASVEKLVAHKIDFETGKHSDRVLDAEMVVLSPGIPFASPLVQKLVARKIPIFSEIEVAGWFNKSPLIAVTGSNGKTTTTTLIGEMLRQQDKKAIVAGNIGAAFSEFVSESRKNRWAVVELSSFQLETIETFSPQIAIVLNFAPNHLDRYESYDAYLQAKWRITKNLTEQDTLIYNGDDATLSAWAEKIKCKKYAFVVGRKNDSGAAFYDNTIFLFGEPVITEKEIALNGVHNYMNVMAALLAVQQAVISPDQLRSVLQSFSGIEHRLEKVTEEEGVLFINDSKATTIESLSYALKSYSRPIILIAGGKDKGSDFSRLNPLIEKHVRSLILIGSASQKMAEAWQKLKPIKRAKTLSEAVLTAKTISKKNDVVLLSPACASFDMFKDYEDRGRQFKKLVLGKAFNHEKPWEMA